MDQKKTGAFIKQKRIEAGLTQQEIAERLGVGNKTVSRWETGVYMPDISLLAPLADLLGVEVSELLNAEERYDTDRMQEVPERLADKKAEKPVRSRSFFIILILMVVSVLCFADVAYGYFSTSLNWNITGGYFDPKGLIFRYVFGFVEGGNAAGIMLTRMFRIFIIFLLITIALVSLMVVVSTLEKRRFRRT